MITEKPPLSITELRIEVAALQLTNARLRNALCQIDVTRVPPDIAKHITRSLEAFT